MKHITTAEKTFTLHIPASTNDVAVPVTSDAEVPATSEDAVNESSVWLVPHDNFNANLRYSSEFKRPNIHTVHYGNDSLGNFGSVTWHLIPQNIKILTQLNSLKTAIRKWTPNECPCRLYQTYIGRLGYTNVIWFFISRIIWKCFYNDFMNLLYYILSI